MKHYKVLQGEYYLDLNKQTCIKNLKLLQGEYVVPCEKKIMGNFFITDCKNNNLDECFHAENSVYYRDLYINYQYNYAYCKIIKKYPVRIIENINLPMEIFYPYPDQKTFINNCYYFPALVTLRNNSKFPDEWYEEIEIEKEIRFFDLDTKKIIYTHSFITKERLFIYEKKNKAFYYLPHWQNNHIQAIVYSRIKDMPKEFLQFNC